MDFIKKFKESLKCWGGNVSLICEDDDYMVRPVSENIKQYVGSKHKDWKGHDDWEAIFVNAFLAQELNNLTDGPNDMHQLSRMTESPIEIQLLFAIILSARENGVGKVEIAGKARSKVPERKPLDVEIEYSYTAPYGEHNRLLVEPQKKVGEYRVDFLLTFTGVRQWNWDDSGNRTPVNKIMNQMVIECDGHDFHEKTKEQAKRDKSRDRTLQQVGYKIYHFTGSEIYQDNMRCAELVIKDLTENSFRSELEG